MKKQSKEFWEYREKEDKRRNIRYYITLPIASILIFIFLITFWATMDTSKMSIQCSVSDIEYRDVSPSICWNSDDYNASTYCPLPHNIDCKGDVESFGTIIGSILASIIS